MLTLERRMVSLPNSFYCHIIASIFFFGDITYFAQHEFGASDETGFAGFENAIDE